MTRRFRYRTIYESWSSDHNGNYAPDGLSERDFDREGEGGWELVQVKWTDDGRRIIAAVFRHEVTGDEC